MRVPTQTIILCALVCACAMATPSAAQAPNGIRVATAAPAAESEQKFTFLLFWKENNPATQAMHETLKRAVDTRSQRAEWVSVNINDGAQRPLVDRYRVERAPMPMVICVAPNGAVTGGFPHQINDAVIEKALITPGMTEATKALQDKKIVVIQAKRYPDMALPAGVASFVSDPSFKDRTAVISVNLDDPAESRFVREMEFNPQEVSDSMIVVLAPPGVLVGKYQSTVAMEQIAADLHTAGKCCNDPKCKHNKKGH